MFSRAAKINLDRQIDTAFRGETRSKEHHITNLIALNIPVAS